MDVFFYVLEGKGVVEIGEEKKEGRAGPLIGPCGFSSLAATRDWLKTDIAKAFIRAYRRTRIYLNAMPAAEIARAEKRYFPDIDEKP